MNILNSMHHKNSLSFIIVQTVEHDLLYYITFEQMYNSTGGNWTSGIYYIGNIANGTVTDLFEADIYSNTEIKPDLTIIKHGLQSLYIKNTAFRQINPSFQFTQSTGLSFSIWCRISKVSTTSMNNMFQFSDTYPTDTIKTVGMRIKPTIMNNVNGPFYINVSCDDSTYVSGGTLVSGETIQANAWYHYVWTISPALYDGECRHNIYINNRLIQTYTKLYPKSVSRSRIHFGGEGTINVDSFRMYKRELKSTEVRKIYTNLDQNQQII
jgi:hypothetical protein